VFTELSTADDNFAAKVYREHPNHKKSDWKKIEGEIRQIGAMPYGVERTKKVRTAFANSIDILQSSLFYLNLSDTDRALIAQHIFQSTRDVQDRGYYFESTYFFMYGLILEFILFNSWDGDEHSKAHLKELHKNYMDLCRDHCQLLLQIARARSEGRELSEKEKEAGEPVVTLREATRRALSGEKVFDDQ
jgi:hypothetical protein